MHKSVNVFNIIFMIYKIEPFFFATDEILELGITYFYFELK